MFVILTLHVYALHYIVDDYIEHDFDGLHLD